MEAKRWERIEIFYDLVYVFAMSKLAVLINTPVGGTIEWRLFFRYFILLFTVLQAWLFMTSYLNQYGVRTWREKVAMAIQMIAAIFIAGKVSVDWYAMSATFHMAMFVNFAVIVYLYREQLRYTKYKRTTQRSLVVSSIVFLIYALALVFALMHVHIPVIGLDVLAFSAGAVIPLLMPGRTYKKPGLFPHVSDHFQFLTMMTFGIAMAAVTSFFDSHSFSMVPVLAFGIVFFLFGCYSVQMHELVEDQPRKRGVVLVCTHFLMIMSIHLLSVSLHLVHDGTMASDYLSYLIVGSLILYFSALMANRIYYKKTVHFRLRDAVQMLIFNTMGAVCILVFDYSVYGVLAGMLITCAGSYYVLNRTRFLMRFQ